MAKKNNTKIGKEKTEKPSNSPKVDIKIPAADFAGLRGFNPRNKSAFLRMYKKDMKTIKQWELITKNKF